LLDIKDVSKRYGRRYALEHVSYDIPESTTTLLLGANGAGKTTLIKCIMGLVHFNGSITVAGLDARKDIKAVHSVIGYMPQQSAFQDNLTIYQHCNFTGRLKGADDAAIRTAIETSGLWEVRNKKIAALSSGMRQRLGITLALTGDPPVVFFDEPTNNIDIKFQIEFQSIVKRLRKNNKTIIIATHISGFDEFAENAIILDGGKLVAAGSTRELLKRIGEEDTVFLKVKDEYLEGVLATLKGLGVPLLSQDGDWISVRLTDESKAPTIQSIVAAGCVIDDVAIESTELESGYFKLGGAKA
jgi:ABC-type multidrug transport system ATPase subunit